jgi:hypothetical protein
MGIPLHQSAELRPPRRGTVWAVSVDSTARVYDLSALDLGNDGDAPNGAGDRPRTVDICLQCETADVYFYFSSASATNLDNTAAQAATSAAAAAQTTHGAVLKSGNMQAGYRINRTTDRYLVVKTASGTATLRLWAASSDST